MTNGQRIGMILAKFRVRNGKTQSYMADCLNVSRRTISRWESGEIIPDIVETFEWFSVLGENKTSALVEYLYPSSVDHSTDVSDKILDRELIRAVMSLSRKEKEELIYFLEGDHGSSRYGIFQLLTTHLHLDLRTRVNVANIVRGDYDMGKAGGTLVNPDLCIPDLAALDKSIELGKDSVMHGKHGYSSH